jgi:predicted ATPase
MFTNIHIERFRGIPNLDLDGLHQINLLVGKNNTGKTSVLEAILLLCGATDPFTPILVGQLRGQRITTQGDADTIWRSLLGGMSVKSLIEIVGWWDNKGQRRLTIKSVAATNYTQDVNGQPPSAIETGGNEGIGGGHLIYTPSNGSVPVDSQAVFDPQTRQVVATPVQRDHLISATFLSSRSFFNLNRDTEKYSSLMRIRKEQQVIKALQLLDSRIQGLAVVSEESGATVYVDIGGESLIPLAVCGEGMLRLFSMVLAIISTRGGVLLVDEIDNGLHYTFMAKFWPVLQTLCSQHHVQLIATTHSEEMLRGAIEAFQNDFSAFGLFRLDRTSDGVRAVGYDDEALQGLMATGWEVRG